MMKFIIDDTSFCLEDGQCLFVLDIPALVQFDDYNVSYPILDVLFDDYDFCL